VADLAPTPAYPVAAPTLTAAALDAAVVYSVD